MYYFVLFKASWCGYCRDFINSQLPKIKQYINNNSKYLKLLVYDADANAIIMKQQHIDGYPTIRLYNGTVKNPLQKFLYEFNNRDANDIIKKLNDKTKPKTNEHFTSSIISSKGLTYSSFYENNGLVKGKIDKIVCNGDTCRRSTKVIDDKGKIKNAHKVVPYNDYDSTFKTFYDASLELRNHF